MGSGAKPQKPQTIIENKTEKIAENAHNEMFICFNTAFYDTGKTLEIRKCKQNSTINGL